MLNQTSRLAMHGQLITEQKGIYFLPLELTEATLLLLCLRLALLPGVLSFGFLVCVLVRGVLAVLGLFRLWSLSVIRMRCEDSI